MRTTVTFDDDVAAAIDEIRRERHLGLSEAVNELVRAGLTAPPRRSAFRQRTAEMGARIDVSNVAEALEVIEGPSARGC
jgi:Ribbon-helix-helix protein, copG family